MPGIEDQNVGDAAEVWQGILEGRWSLVRRYDRDGRRFLVAVRNPEGVIDKRRLSAMESRVIALAIRGYTDKAIAYQLGIAPGTASCHLTRAMRKLGFSGRVELVRTLGPREL